MIPVTEQQIPGDRPIGTAIPRHPIIIAVVLSLIVAWALYRPDRLRPFHFLDFGEFIPLIKDSNSFGEQLSAMLGYYLEHGRASVVTLVATVLKWRVFQYWTPGWQMVQALMMLVVMGQTFVLARRLHASRLGAAAAASVFLVAPAAAASWVRLTTAEPLGMIVVLALALPAVRYQSVESWRREILRFGVGAVLLLLTKELMAPMLLLPLFLALCMREGGTFAWPQWSRRDIGLLVGVGLASVLTLVPLALVYLQTPTSAFSTMYGSTMQSPSRLGEIWLETLVPLPLFPDVLSVMWGVALGGYLLILAAGCRIALAADRQRMRWILIAAVMLPLIGALSYAPWPLYEVRYALPYLIGPALLVAFAVTYLQALSAARARATTMALAPVLLFAGSEAAAHAARADSLQRAASQVIDAVVSVSPTDSVLVSTPYRVRLAWIGLGPSLQRLSVATNRPWAPTRDALCEEAASVLARSPHPVVVVFAAHCPGVPRGTRQVMTRYRYVNWADWSIAQDFLRVEIFGPAATLQPPLPAP